MNPQNNPQFLPKDSDGTTQNNNPKSSIKIILVAALIIIGAGLYFLINKNKVTEKNDSVGQTQTMTPEGSAEDIKRAENYKTDLEIYFTPTKAKDFYAKVEPLTFNPISTASEVIKNGNISFSSSWGKLQSVSNVGENITFKFDGSKSINFTKHDSTSALTKTLDKAMTGDNEGWSFPTDFSNKIKTFLTENNIKTQKELVDYSLAINPNDILKDTNASNIIINYSLLHRVKRSLMRNDANVIQKFTTNSVDGYLMVPEIDTESIQFVVFTPSGALYTVSVYNKSKFTTSDIDVFTSSLKIN